MWLYSKSDSITDTYDFSSDDNRFLFVTHKIDTSDIISKFSSDVDIDVVLKVSSKEPLCDKATEIKFGSICGTNVPAAGEISHFYTYESSSTVTATQNLWFHWNQVPKDTTVKLSYYTVDASGNTLE